MQTDSKVPTKVINPERKHLILLVEDEIVVRTIAAEILKDGGYDVAEAGDGFEAWAALQERRPDLILSDVRMPRCNGFDFLQRVRSNNLVADIPFVIVSAAADRADHRMGMSLGADDYVVKPYLPPDLLKTISIRLTRASVVSDKIKAHQRFLSNILPHELRTPLTGVLGYAELMLMTGREGGTLLPEQLVEYGTNIQRSGLRLLEMAKDFSLWAELDRMAAAAKWNPIKSETYERINAVELARILGECA